MKTIQYSIHDCARNIQYLQVSKYSINTMPLCSDYGKLITSLQMLLNTNLANATRGTNSTKRWHNCVQASSHTTPSQSYLQHKNLRPRSERDLLEEGSTISVVCATRCS